MRIFYFLFGLFLMAGLVAADAEWVRGPNSFDSIYCLLTGCNITGNLEIQGNLTVTGDYVNVTVIDYNVTGSMTVDGGVVADNFSGVLFWTDLSAYPAACSAGQFVSAVADTLTCSAPPDNDTNTHVAGNPPYLSNDSTTMYFNETKLNLTIDAREVDTNTHVIGNPPYLSNDSTTMYFNETKLNLTIDAREVDTNTHVAGFAPWLSNDSTTMYFNETYFNTSVTGLQFWTASGSNIYYGNLSDDYFVGIGDQTPDGKLDVSSSNNHTLVIIDNSDLTAADYDPVLLFSLEETTAWNMCVDESDGDKLKIIESSSSCATAPHLEFASDEVKVGTIFSYKDPPIFLTGDDTPSVSGGNVFRTSSGTSNIDRFDDGTEGQMLIILCTNRYTTIDDTPTTHLNSNFRCGSPGVSSNDKDTLTLIGNTIFGGAVHFYELSRSDNT